MFRPMSQIRKDTGKPNEAAGGEVRRSRRDRVPNNKYAESIEEMFRSMTGKDNRPRNDRNLNSEESSWSHRKPEDEEVSRHEGTDWLKCVLPEPDSKGRLIDLEIVFGRPTRRKASEYSEMRRPIRKKSDDEADLVEQPRKMAKKASDSAKPPKSGGLLEMLMQAAEKAAKAPEHDLRDRVQTTINQILEDKALEDEEPSHQEDEDTEGKIVRVVQYEDKVVFEHSKNGQIEVPMVPESPKESSAETAEQQASRMEFKNLQRRFSEYKKKVRTPLILS